VKEKSRSKTLTMCILEKKTGILKWVSGSLLEVGKKKEQRPSKHDQNLERGGQCSSHKTRNAAFSFDMSGKRCNSTEKNSDTVHLKRRGSSFLCIGKGRGVPGEGKEWGGGDNVESSQNCFPGQINNRAGAGRGHIKQKETEKKVRG